MVYSKRKLYDLHENDSINSWEEGFMQGYLEEED